MIKGGVIAPFRLKIHILGFAWNDYFSKVSKQLLNILNWNFQQILNIDKSFRQQSKKWNSELIKGHYLSLFGLRMPTLEVDSRNRSSHVTIFSKIYILVSAITIYQMHIATSKDLGTIIYHLWFIKHLGLLHFVL